MSGHIHVSSKPAAAARSRRRILTVDDEPATTRNLKLLLESTGSYEVRGENDSKQAVETARASRPDLILLDVVMPVLDGWEVAARLRLDPELKDTPIVFLTALASNRHTGGHAVATGTIVFLAKPVELEELLRCIEEQIRK